MRWFAPTLVCILGCGRLGFETLDSAALVGETIDGETASEGADAQTDGLSDEGGADAEVGNGAAGNATDIDSNGDVEDAGATAMGDASETTEMGGIGGTSGSDEMTGNGGSGGVGGATPTGGAGGSGGATDNGGAGGSGGTTETGGASGSGGTGSGEACSGGPSATQTWSFDADLEDWTKLDNNGASGTLTWSSEVGNPSNGAIQYDAISGDGFIGEVVRSLSSPADLSDRTVFAWIMAAGGEPASANFIGATTLTTTAYGARVELSPETWTCVTFEPGTPETAPGGYDPTQVRWLGIQFSGSAPFRVYVDQVSY